MTSAALETGALVARHRRRARRVVAGLAVAVLVVLVLALGQGAVAIPPLEIGALLLRRLGLPVAADPLAQAVFEQVRAPRVMLAFAAGAALAVSGAAAQGVFRNPLADPGLIGVSSGAALAAVAVIVLGPALFGELSPAIRAAALPVAAFLGGLAATAVVYVAARSEGRLVVSTMLLTGVATGALAGAGIGWLTFLSDEQQLRMLAFWTLGSAGAATWLTALPTLALTGLSVAALVRLGPALNAMALGETEARALGVDPTRLTRTTAAFAALAVAAATAACGVIGFVGLVAPHLVRLVLGPDHRVLLPASALLGGGLLVAADTLARVAVAPTELPLGVVTALIGGPFFFWLLLRDKRRSLT
ncbi:FecCD family ABC transporter permease [Brevundimonas balnearis]|uniref:FecCD family ABC transporter permease n=1 Tax=Brevundimonas balnearis TaxID=1572858 RepID=A0ABV6QZF3_9CAUL